VLATLALLPCDHNTCVFYEVAIRLEQWFPNFFMLDPNLSLMNISRSKPKTSRNVVYFTCLESENVLNYSATT